MKKGIIAIIILIPIIGLTAFSFSNIDKKNPKSCNARATKLPVQAVNLSGDLAQSSFPSSKDNDLFYMVSPKYKRSITKEQLHAANAVSDVIEHYPSNWIDVYKSVEIIGTCDGKQVKAVGYDVNLTKEQEKIFKTADSSTDVAINISYQRKASNNRMEDHELNISLNLTPKTQAEYVGGTDLLIKTLKENSIDKIDTKKLDPRQPVAILFTINEEGGVENVELSLSSGDDKTDELLISLIQKMPNWIPAKDSEGTLVKQVFEFVIGNGNC